MKILLIGLIATTVALAQYATVPSSSYPALDAVIDSKLTATRGAGAPSSSCTAGKDVYTDTSAGDFYVCVAANTWAKRNITGAPSSWPTIPAAQVNADWNVSSGLAQILNKPTWYYQTFLSGGSAVTQRPTVNWISGTNATVTCVDNSGSTRTDCTVSATAGAGGYAAIEQNGGSPLTARTTLNFIGATVADNAGAGRTDVTITAGSGALVVTTGAGAPSANCVAPSTSNLAEYFDTTNLDVWLCSATNTWKKFISSPGTGQYVLTGATGSAPGNPTSGSVRCYFDSTSNTQICLDTSGNAFTMVKGASSTANQFLTNIDALGIQQKRQPAAADVTGLAASATTDTTNAANISSGTLPAARLAASPKCTMMFGATGGTALTTANYQPMRSQCTIGATSTLYLVIVYADAGASTVQVGYRRSGSTTALTPVLTPATVSGITDKVACANAGGTAVTLEGTSVTCSTLSATSLTQYDELETIGGAADGTSAQLKVTVIY